MVATIQASKLSIGYLEDNFHLQQNTDEQFFTEWFANLPELSSQEKTALDQIKRNYLYLTEDDSRVESIVKMVILSPLLNLAGFFQPPFKVLGEKSIELSIEDKEGIIKGEINILVVQNQLWVLVIESKRPKLSLEEGRSKTLAYMLANPSEKPSFGFLTNGSHFLFFKLVKGENIYYSLSDEFSLFRRQNELYDVLRIMKHIGQIIIT